MDATERATVEQYRALERALGPTEATHEMDKEIAWETAKRRLLKKGIRRSPTEAEMHRILDTM
ncbi:MAG: hypothetical protein BWY79_02106 [Actinobacteria bacterium ADurb.Bin444]|nr:MAG: hypothetical protein BWY79_02106 [Actinobacteria bacterium ADurb.Bin444]